MNMIQMKNYKKIACLAAVLSILCAGGASAAALKDAPEIGPGIPRGTEAAEEMTGEKTEERAGTAKTEKKKDVEDSMADEVWTARLNALEGASEADGYILAIGDGSSHVEVSYYTKSGDGRWKQEFSVSGLYGRKGATSQKKEGDEKTPLGTYSFTMAFGIKDDPGSILPYHKLNGKDYWVDDSASRYYNKLVNTGNVKKDWNSAEHMIGVDPYYNYGLALNYNSDCVPGKGSAIFLHCTKDETDIGTSGCVKIPEEYMKTLVCSVTDKTRIVIVSDISQLP